MDLWTLVMNLVFGLSAVGLGCVAWWGNRWWRLVALLLFIPWIYYGSWYAKALWDVRLVDDQVSRTMQDHVLAAIARGDKRVPLADITPFRWQAVCEIWASEDYTQDAELQRLFGPDHPVNLNAADVWADHPYPLFATDRGPYLLQPFFGRLTEEFQGRWHGRHYAQALQGQGYVLELELIRNPANIASRLCYTPEESWLRIAPEPDWMKGMNKTK